MWRTAEMNPSALEGLELGARVGRHRVADTERGAEWRSRLNCESPVLRPRRRHRGHGGPRIPSTNVSEP
jgi:hypothetical protein